MCTVVKKLHELLGLRMEFLFSHLMLVYKLWMVTECLDLTVNLT